MRTAVACNLVTVLLLGTASAQLPGAVSPAQPRTQRSSELQGEMSIPLTSAVTGSAPEGAATAEEIPLTLSDALDRGVRQNLAAILSTQNLQLAAAARLKQLADLLPNASARTAENIQQINLDAFGFPRPPGTPAIIGPFSVFDARGAVTQRIVDLSELNQYRAAKQNEKAARFSYDETRELVVLIISNLYLEALADTARVDAGRAQFRTAEEVNTQTRHLKDAGLVAGIDVLRAQIQLRGQQQRLIAAENELEKRKLALARAIGLPAGQRFTLATPMPLAPKPPLALQEALQLARVQRPEYKRAEAVVAAAELNARAARAEHLPTLDFNGDYGVLGRRPTSSHGTFTAALSLNVPIFEGGRVQANVRQAKAQLQQRRAELADTGGRIDSEVRQAFLDVESAMAQVEVAQGAISLADEQLVQARDRLAAGIAGSLEVVESEASVREANENYIQALYVSNVAKATLARAVGSAERTIKEFLGAK